ncbi:hypothetical protein K2173_015818 [Erythroxylum novogranatense]|uniref:DUF4378 domain-containing protein n=1 Tax=Erythroxylum novogranatense TaxID=1862640 RepID=A0AAV8SEF8_9ROSI|nr:hypothetical protein K2173_015818 [Erythroxylum novogranatense]
MWNILHLLDHLPWHSSKNFPLRRKQRRGKYSLCYGGPKTLSLREHCDDVQEYLDAEAVPLMDDEQIKNAGPIKLSDTDRIKTVLAKDTSAASEMQQSISIHHLEPPDHIFSKISTDCTNSTITLYKNADTMNFVSTEEYSKVSQNSTTAKRENLSIQRSLSDNREASRVQFIECADVMELFQVNQKLFLEILQDACAQVTKSTHVEHSSMKARLKKSGSFPAAASKHIQFMRPVGLKHKHMEIRSFPKVQRSPVVTEAPKFVAPICLDDSQEKSIAFKADASEGSAISQDTSISIPVSSQLLEKHRWRQSFTAQLREIKKKIKLAFKERKKEKTRFSSEALLKRVCYESDLPANKEKSPESLEETAVRQEGEENSTSCHEVNGSENYLRKDGLPQMRRATSLNESVHRYALLYENCFCRKATWHEYKSRRSISEVKFPSDENGLKSFKRRLSLSDLEFCPFPNEIPCNLPKEGIGIRPVMDYGNTNSDNEGKGDLKSLGIPADRKNFEPQETLEDFCNQDNMVETGISIENTDSPSCSIEDMDEENNTKGKQGWELVESTKRDSISHQDQHIVSTNISLPHQDQTELPISQDLPDNETDSKNCSIHGQDSYVNLQEKSARHPLTLVCSSTSCNNTMTDNHFLLLKWNWQDINDFNYVRDVLEVAGFIEKEHLGSWHSLDQPLNPIVFKELENQLHPELNSSDDFPCNCDHQLLFDLMNELLLEIYSSSLAYFPEPIPFTPRRVRPLPRGDQALEEVWKGVSLYRRLQSLVDKSLDDIVAADMDSSDGWMNLLLDGEDVALDLEEMIFDQVIDEIVCA